MNLDAMAWSDPADDFDPVASESTPPSPIGREALFLFRIGNYSHIAKAFGTHEADHTVAAALAYMASLVEEDGSVALCRHDVVGVRLTSGPTLGGSLEAKSCEAWMRLVCETLPLIPIECSQGPVHLWISGFWTFPAGEEDVSPHRWQLPYACPGQNHPGWDEQYRSDMVNASRALAAMRVPAGCDPIHGSAVRPFWQRVHSASNGATQFFEALARLSDANGRPCSIAECVLSLERTGFIRLLDLHMVRQIVAELERSPEIQAAVNLSALSIRDDPWWDEVKTVLLARPSVASRLFLEITETASFQNISEAIGFVDGMRRLGCKIVLDDFGAGHASVRQLFALNPDVVKIDRLFLRRAALSDRDREIFSCLVRLARSSGATVVAEGVETSLQKQIALEAGADWQQGYLWGQVSGGHPRSCSGAITNLRTASAA